MSVWRRQMRRASVFDGLWARTSIILSLGTWAMSTCATPGLPSKSRRHYRHPWVIKYGTRFFPPGGDGARGIQHTRFV